METRTFIFVIDTERHFNVLVRIIGTLNRQRIAIKELSSHLKHGDDRLRITVSIDETRANAVKLSKRFHREIDVIEINLFEQLN